MENLTIFLTALFISFILVANTHAGQNVEFGDTTDPTTENGNGNCPSGFIHHDLNADGLEQNGECWRGMVIKDGQVGIGTDSPDTYVRLHVVSDLISGGTGVFERSNNDNNFRTSVMLYRTRSDAVAPSAGFGANLNYALEGYTDGSKAGVAAIAATWEVDQTNDTTDRDAALSFETTLDGTRTEKLRITSAGNVGIGTTSPSYKLHVNGTAAGTSWTNLSSREYKEDIKKLDSSKHDEMLSHIMKLKLTTYKYKKEFGDDDTKKLGFIAEEMPEQVLSKDGKGVDIYELLAFTIGAMKAQQKELEKLKLQINRKEL